MKNILIMVVGFFISLINQSYAQTLLFTSEKDTAFIQVTCPPVPEDKSVLSVHPGTEPVNYQAYHLEDIGCKDKSALTVFAEGFKNRERVKCISNFIYNAADPSLIKFHITVNKDSTSCSVSVSSS